jgi:CDP-diacylglycerol--glycerol-3-phosphate 3-phosphatidyltransferase
VVSNRFAALAKQDHRTIFRISMKILTLPNILTLIRLILSPIALPVLLAYLLPLNIWEVNFALAGLFVLFGITDYFDGYFARRYAQESLIGGLLDPIADKFLLYSTLIGLLAANKIYFFWVVLLIGREFFIMGVRLVALEHQYSIPVSYLAKLKTAITMLCLTYIIYNPYHQLGLMGAFYANLIEYALLATAIGLSLLTAKQYFNRFMVRLNLPPFAPTHLSIRNR